MFSTGIGALRLDRIDELSGPAVAPRKLLPDLPPDAEARNAAWFAPTFYDPHKDALILSLHGWVVRTKMRMKKKFESSARNRFMPKRPMSVHITVPST